MQRPGFTRLEFALTLAVTGVLCITVLPMLPSFARTGKAARSRQDKARAKANADRTACQRNLREIALGIKQYVKDWDEKFPLVAGPDRNTYGWASNVHPYMKSLMYLQCPTDRHATGTDPRRRGFTDYWYNRHLSGLSESSLQHYTHTVLLGDGDGGYKTSTARYAISALPSGWPKTPKSPARRHLDAANYAFTDGHVKWLKPGNITTKEANGAVYTFKIGPPDETSKD